MTDFLKAKKYIVLAVFFTVYTVYMLWRIVFTLPFSYGAAATVFGILLLISELVGYAESIIFYLTVHDVKTPDTPKARTSRYPEVDVFVTAYNEPVELLFKTVVGCRNMDYPEKDKRVHIFICDDGHRDELRDMCAELGVGYITRSDNKHAKAGNLNNALTFTSAPYVVTFDADMIPTHDFLMKTIPFFMEEGKKIGFVQVPQNFYNADSFQYNLFAEKRIPNEQHLFSRLIQAGKMKYNAVIYAGSNTVISRQALCEIGGFVTGTITEDFATGMLIESRGYRGVYLNEVHASGLAPENLEDLYNQRIRWGRGVVQTFKAHNPFRIKGIDFKQKLMYLSALTYWFFGIWRLIYFISPILFSIFGLVILKTDFGPLLYIWLPMFLLSGLTFRVFSNNYRTTTWSHIYDTIMFPQITKGVVAESLGLKLTKFKVTPKENVVRNTFQNKYRLVWLQICLLLLSLIGLVKIVVTVFTAGQLSAFAINLFWLGYNSFLLLIAIFFASERPKFRRYERMLIREKAVVTGKNRVVRCWTYDLSESGVSVVIPSCEAFEKNAMCRIDITSGRYCTSFSAELVHARAVNNSESKYAFVIRNIDRQNFCQLILILHDRTNMMQEEINENSYMRMFRDNIISRFTPVRDVSRKQPRFDVDRFYEADACGEKTTLFIHDLSFTHCTVRTERQYSNMTISFGAFVLRFGLDEAAGSRNGYTLYKIKNSREEMTNAFIGALIKSGKSVEPAQTIAAGLVL
jgi:cellulose synthase (UDP-forming)